MSRKKIDLCEENTSKLPTYKCSSFSKTKVINEDLLLEKTRQELINKSKNAQNYAASNQSKGRNRYERRKYSKIANSVRDYNNINMDVFWKDDILEFVIKVNGETNNYDVTITFENILKRLANEVKANKNKLEFKCVLRALIAAFNNNDVYVSCSCPDFVYSGINYYAAKQNFNSKPIMGKAMQAPLINNPGDTKGAGCKHILLCLSNIDWMMKIASVINNYIKYCRDNLQLIYADYIFPKVYDMPYKQAVQLDLFTEFDENDTPLIPSDFKTMKNVIDTGFKGKDEKGKFVKGNEFRFKKKEEPKQEVNNSEPLFHQESDGQNTERRYKIDSEEV